MARAAAEGHRVVLVVATNGEHGEVPDDLAAGRDAGRSPAGRDRAHRRPCSASTASCGSATSDSRHDGLGAERPIRRRSTRPTVDEAAERLADRSCARSRADVLTIYDWHGNYGHPDHIKVHQVGHRGRRAGRHADGLRGDDEPRPHRPDDGDGPRGRRARWRRRATSSTRTAPPTTATRSGMPEAELTLAVDVARLRRRRSGRRCAAIAARSPTPSFFLQMPDEVFAARSAPSGSSSTGVDAAVREPGWIFDHDPAVPRPPRARRGGLGQRPGSRRSTTSAAARRHGRRRRGSAPLGAAADRRQPAAALPGDRGRTRRAVARSSAQIEPRCAEIPSPEGVADGGAGRRGCGGAMAGTWTELGPRYVALPRRRGRRARRPSPSTPWSFSHFVAINAAIGAAARRRSARHPQPRQLLGHRRRRRRAGVAAALSRVGTRPTR